ncbi:MAG: epoxyqueuosine reductase [Thermosediminibacterales bacterium]|nr:epoxyqueuosine reductase [Thermosediminibacterales bacterium]
MNLKQKIQQFAKTIGIDLIGFTTAEPFEETERILQELSKNIGSEFPFINHTAKVRCNPKHIMPNARSIISAAISYTVSEEKLPKRDDSPFLGWISRYAVSRDYHIIMEKKLQQVAEYIKQIKPIEYKIFVDDGLMVDRAVAQRAGIGWFGGNTCIFTEEYGSWVFLGNILLDIEIEPDTPLHNKCDRCGRCVKACPTGALVEPYVVNPYRCLSYITQMRGCIPREFRPLMSKRIYGCDTCQYVCPKNHEIKAGDHEEFYPLITPYPDLISILNMSKKEFDITFGKTAAGWRGKNIIQRNAVIALGNYKDERAGDVIKKALLHPSPQVRGHAAWALTRIEGYNYKNELEKAIRRETDEYAKREMLYSLENGGEPNE